MSCLSIFHPLIQDWFTDKIGLPTDVQSQAWPQIAKDRHVLVSAPTGSGKTLTAFLWAINQLVTGTLPCGQIRILYVSPLKALNNDIQRNLLKPLKELEEYFKKSGEKFPSMRVFTRSGDTPQDERQKMNRRPPEILITTPESLNILLCSSKNRHILSGIATVILDEIHAVVGTKRGVHLITAVDRLIPLCGEFQRIALSATVKPMEKVADFVGGYRQIGSGPDYHYEKRKVSLIRSGETKKYQIKVCFPDDARDRIKDDSWWPALINQFKEIISINRSTLFFGNSRRTVEKVTRFINEQEPVEIAYSHHGSLSKEIRLAVEQKLKNNELKAIVATSSLELGIDIGELDQVVLVQSPRSISSAIQRIGRSGHKVGKVSRGALYPTHGRDFLEAAVIACSIIEQDLEEISPIEAPLDVLAQIILSMTAVEQWNIDVLYSFLKTSYSYRALSRKHYDLVLEMLAGRYADSRIRELKPRVSLDLIDNTIKAKKGVLFLLYMAGGTIPDRGYFNLRIQDSHAKLGELDEEFVWERSIGETFTLGTQLWKIKRITHNDVEVIPSNDTLNIIPFWKAEDQNRDFHLSQKISIFLEAANHKINNPQYKKELTKRYFMDPPAADELIRFLKQQRKTTESELPHRHHLLIEHYDDPANKADSKQVLLHTLWGGRVNRPFALALSAAWEKKFNYPLQVIVNNDSILLMLPHDFSTQDIFRLVTPENIETLLRRKLEQTGFFGARFRENAGRSFLLPKVNFKKRMPLWLNRLRSGKLLDAVSEYKDFPILLETWRTCLQDEFDCNNLKILLDEIQSGAIAISETVTTIASPFAGNIIWKQTNKYMYEDDTPDSNKQSSLHQQLIKELVFSSHLRPLIPRTLINSLNEKLKRTAPGYSPGSAQDLLDWVKDRLLLPENEWAQLQEAIKRDHDIDPINHLKSNKKKLVWIRLPNVKSPFLCAVEILPLIADSFQIKRDNLSIISEESISLPPLNPKGGGEPKWGMADFFSQWLSYHGPITKIDLCSIFGLTGKHLDEMIAPLIEAQDIVQDRLSKDCKSYEICDRENLEILLRMARKQREPVFKSLNIECLHLFLSMFQGIATKGDSMESLQERLEQLFGLPIPARAWEEHILPTRIQSFRTAWLDTLMQSSDLIWFGCGKKKISLTFTQDLELFQESEEASKANNIETIIPDRRGKYSFSDIVAFSGQDTGATTKILWDLAWAGQITNDSFITIRKGILNNFTPSIVQKNRSPSGRSGYNRWKSTRPIAGNWYTLNRDIEPPDILEQAEYIKDRIRQLFKRYGILFRELLANELTLLQWRNIFKSLRLMELSGEVLTGHFFKGIPGPQFISHEAYRLLQKPLPRESIYWLNASDPASLCGVKLQEIKLPARIPSTQLVYHGAKLVLISKRNGKDINIKVSQDSPHLQNYFSLFKDILSREFNPITKIKIETINAEPATTSPYSEPLQRFGFHAGYKCLEMWRNY